jgi:hypothetical protein
MVSRRSRAGLISFFEMLQMFLGPSPPSPFCRLTMISFIKVLGQDSVLPISNSWLHLLANWPGIKIRPRIRP